MAQRVLVYGGKGALGSAIVAHFKTINCVSKLILLFFYFFYFLSISSSNALLNQGV